MGHAGDEYRVGSQHWPRFCDAARRRASCAGRAGPEEQHSAHPHPAWCGDLFVAALLPYIKRFRSKWLGELETRDQPSLEGAALAAELAVVNRATAPEQIEIPGGDVLDASRYSLGQFALGGLLDFDHGPAFPTMRGCEGRLYLYDELAGRLLPAVEPDDGRSHGWTSGVGVVGVAWQENVYVLALDDATHDGTYGLSREQQRRYADLTAVAAVPVRNASDRSIAVLSVATRQTDHVLHTEEAYLDLLLLSELMARVLVDLLGWFPDDGV